MRVARNLNVAAPYTLTTLTTRLTCPAPSTQTQPMAHIYMQFDFSSDEEKAQLARHKLEVWKQAFRLDKKLLYRFERSGEATTAEEVKAEKPETSQRKSNSKLESTKKASKVSLLVRL